MQRRGSGRQRSVHDRAMVKWLRGGPLESSGRRAGPWIQALRVHQEQRGGQTEAWGLGGGGEGKRKLVKDRARGAPWQRCPSQPVEVHTFHLSGRLGAWPCGGCSAGSECPLCAQLGASRLQSWRSLAPTSPSSWAQVPHEPPPRLMGTVCCSQQALQPDVCSDPDVYGSWEG